MTERKINWGAWILFITLCATACYVLLFLPIPRQIGLTFRNTLYVFPLIFALALACCAVKSAWLRAFISALLFGTVLLPYSGLLNSGTSDQYALGGIVPWSDAFTMQLNTQRFLYGGQMGQATAIRPLSTVFYGLFLHIFNNNYLALQIFLCVITGFCLLSAMGSVKRSFGSVAGAMFFTILYYYIRQRLGTYMTEPYGFICGLLSCQLILTGIRTRKQLYLLDGFLMLSIGMNARPAAMFIFPAVGLWYFFIFLKNEKGRFLWAVAALALMLSGFGLNRMAQKAVYGDQKIPNRQAAEMVYGLCRGGESWGDVVSLPEMTALNKSENVIADVAALCGPILKEHPENIFKALKTIFYDSLIRSQYYGAFSFVNGNPIRFQTPFRYFLMLLWVCGIIVLFTGRKDPLCSLMLLSVLGVTLSECAAVPFSTNYLRLYAVSMWVPACVVGIFPQNLVKKILSLYANNEIEADPLEQWGSPVILGFMILCGAILGPVYLKTNPLPRPVVQNGICAEGENVLITSIDPGSYFYMADQADLTAEHYPYFRLAYVRQHFHDTASQEMFEFTDAIENPTAVIRGIDLVNLKDALVFAPLEMVEGKTGVVQFCGNFLSPSILRNDRFFIPTSAVFIEDGL